MKTRIANLLIAGVISVLFGGVCLQARADVQEAVSVERDVRIPMRDGINMGATIFRPKDMPKPLPVIFCFSPYGTDSPGWRRRGGLYAKRGYVAATVDVRGCGHSEGEFVPFVNEGRDGHDVVQWLASQPWSNGKVAMFGGSYLGWSQWSTIKEFPPNLETFIAPANAGSLPQRGGSAAAARR